MMSFGFPLFFSVAVEFQLLCFKILKPAVLNPLKGVFDQALEMPSLCACIFPLRVLIIIAYAQRKHGFAGVSPNLISFPVHVLMPAGEQGVLSLTCCIALSESRTPFLSPNSTGCSHKSLSSTPVLKSQSFSLSKYKGRVAARLL